MKKIDKEYCMSSYLVYKFVEDENTIFKEGMDHKTYVNADQSQLLSCYNADDVDQHIKELLDAYLSEVKGRVGIFLSGGIDSAILASYLPEGSIAYTARCPGGPVDETPIAAKYAEKYKLEHRIVDIEWDTYLKYAPELMLHDGCPLSSNEPQVYKLILAAQEDGVEHIVFGDNADMAFGGLNELLSKDWTFAEWVKRYTYVDAAKVLCSPVDVYEVYERYRKDGDKIDFIKFLSEVFAAHSSGAYLNAFGYAGMDSFDPYSRLKMAEPLDLERVRSGENKYILRELFKNKYPGFEVPYKLAMPRAVDTWLKDWKGPEREEFLPGCIEGITGEGKWMIYCLEWFLNLIEKETPLLCGNTSQSISS